MVRSQKKPIPRGIVKKQSGRESLIHVADQLDEIFQLMVGGIFHPEGQ
jgi:hypothetical protein